VHSRAAAAGPRPLPVAGVHTAHSVSVAGHCHVTVTMMSSDCLGVHPQCPWAQAGPDKGQVRFSAEVKGRPLSSTALTEAAPAGPGCAHRDGVPAQYPARAGFAVTVGADDQSIGLC
jgi:hypothetical protein